MTVRKALVLAAGSGSRLGRFTENIPKPMLRVHNRPVLETHVRRLAAAGRDEEAAAELQMVNELNPTNAAAEADLRLVRQRLRAKIAVAFWARGESMNTLAFGILPSSISAIISVTTSWVRSTAKEGISNAPLRAAASWISLARISRRWPGARSKRSRPP